MNCEEFEAIGLDAERDVTLSAEERTAAQEHVSVCPRCAALQESWRMASAELRVFGDATRTEQALPRVEMRLLQEFRTRHRTMKTRRAAVIATWTLATAAVLVGAVSWINWRKASPHNDIANHTVIPTNSGGNLSSHDVTGAGTNSPSPDGSLEQGSAPDEALMADNSVSGFTLLPGSVPIGIDDAEIVRVRMQRGALGSLGFPVNEERAGEWIQVELLVGSDGLPEAVRLPK